MANNRFESNLDQFIQEVRELPQAVVADAGDIVDQTGEFAKSSIDQAYPVGHVLRGKTDLTPIRAGGTLVAGVRIRNRSPLAWIYENGTQARHTALGQYRGAMPPGHVFIPAVIRWRRWMSQQLTALLQRYGLVVSGEA